MIYGEGLRRIARWGRRDRRPLDVETRRARRRRIGEKCATFTYQRALEDGFAAMGLEDDVPGHRLPVRPPSLRDFDRWGQLPIPLTLDGKTPCRVERCSIIGLHGLHIRIEEA